VLVDMDIPKALKLGECSQPTLPPGYLDAGQLHAEPQGHGEEHGQFGPQGHSRLVFIGSPLSSALDSTNTVADG